MKIEISEEERKGLIREIEGAMDMNRRENEEDSADEWIDHSDMEEDIEPDEQDSVLDDGEIWNYIAYYDKENLRIWS